MFVNERHIPLSKGKTFGPLFCNFAFQSLLILRDFAHHYI